MLLTCMLLKTYKTLSTTIKSDRLYYLFIYEFESLVMCHVICILVTLGYFSLPFSFLFLLLFFPLYNNIQKRTKHMSSNYKFKSDTIENDYGVFSIEETMQLNDKRRISRINSSSPSSNNSLSGRRSSISNSSNISEVAPAIKSTSHHFRMIVCGDSGSISNFIC